MWNSTVIHTHKTSQVFGTTFDFTITSWQVDKMLVVIVAKVMKCWTSNPTPTRCKIKLSVSPMSTWTGQIGQVHISIYFVVQRHTTIVDVVCLIMMNEQQLWRRRWSLMKQTLGHFCRFADLPLSLPIMGKLRWHQSDQTNPEASMQNVEWWIHHVISSTPKYIHPLVLVDDANMVEQNCSCF